MAYGSKHSKSCFAEEEAVAGRAGLFGGRVIGSDVGGRDNGRGGVAAGFLIVSARVFGPNPMNPSR